VVTGYEAALALGADIIVKLDGDGQMAPEKIADLIDPILRGEADYLKGNRFFNVEDLRLMPRLRLLGNAGLSFLSKLSSGYWNLFDPTNGFTAIHATAAALLPLNKLSKGYFFESDTLFRLNVLRAVVLEVPMAAHYAGEHSSLSIAKSLLEFPFLHLRNLIKRIFYDYFLRDFNMASINLVLGTVLLLFGLTFGSVHWIRGYAFDVLASPGTVMLAALPVILGSQLLLSFINFDLANVPRRPLQRMLRRTIPAASLMAAAGDVPRASRPKSPR
jgi:glycosyltransferase involved in cell wall biosynthesis